MTDKKKTQASDEPLKVSVVPADNRSDEEKAAMAETQTPENVENREKSYRLPVEGVNLDSDDEDED